MTKTKVNKSGFLKVYHYYKTYTFSSKQFQADQYFYNPKKSWMNVLNNRLYQPICGMYGEIHS